eukprot:8184156-Alexandrium_andersonii.AAC.1
MAGLSHSTRRAGRAVGYAGRAAVGLKIGKCSRARMAASSLPAPQAQQSPCGSPVCLPWCKPPLPPPEDDEEQDDDEDDEEAAAEVDGDASG